ncbi:hypothetical protein HPB52_017710 [Rhipicephalus sanguineus]|uniref:Secreted protein n=1 Tax=Rhipicephalus sanguineus TaxID=34632 RepID=A0A9D4Q1K6_RHISA|nr:hypothetical protein HPB52_017710 [Rhipicephalus sanguineus]
MHCSIVVLGFFEIVGYCRGKEGGDDESSRNQQPAPTSIKQLQPVARVSQQQSSTGHHVAGGKRYEALRKTRYDLWYPAALLAAFVESDMLAV